MKNWKFYVIFVIIAGALALDYPTVKNFFFGDADEKRAAVAARHEKANDVLSSLSGLNLFLAEPEKKRIRAIVEPDFAFDIANPFVSEILEGKFSFEETPEGKYLNLINPAEDVLTEEYAGKLNDLSENVSKIKEITISEDGESLLFRMHPGRRVAESSQPAAGILGDDFDWFYEKGTDTYFSTLRSSPYLVNLGLDLQGGIYLDVGVETEKVVDQIVRDLRFQIEDVLIENDLYFEEIEIVDSRTVQILVGDEIEAFDTELAEFETYTQNFTVAKTAESVVISLSDEELGRIKENAVKQAIQTLRSRIDELGVREPTIQRRGDNSIIIQLPGKTDPARAKELLTKTASLEFRMVKHGATADDPGDGVVFPRQILDPVSKEVVQTRSIVLEPVVAMKGERISDARLSFSNYGAAEVQFTLDSAGADIFGELTRENVGKQLAIVLDGVIQSDPSINSPILSGNGVITGDFTPEEATDLAIVLRSGKLPAPLIVNEERTVGASLGEDSIRQSLESFLLGMVLLVLLIAVYYRIPGFFSVLALLVNLSLILAMLAYFGATLTLPGMAGIILTIGMAVDSNVLIFERIREELARGVPAKRSIVQGFDRALVTILDANFTTLIAALVLLQFGTGPIKGFAVTISIGIITSLFSSVFFTRYLFELKYLTPNKEARIAL